MKEKIEPIQRISPTTFLIVRVPNLEDGVEIKMRLPGPSDIREAWKSISTSSNRENVCEVLGAMSEIIAKHYPPKIRRAEIVLHRLVFDFGFEYLQWQYRLNPFSLPEAVSTHICKAYLAFLNILDERLIFFKYYLISKWYSRKDLFFHWGHSYGNKIFLEASGIKESNIATTLISHKVQGYMNEEIVQKCRYFYYLCQSGEKCGPGFYMTESLASKPDWANDFLIVEVRKTTNNEYPDSISFVTKVLAETNNSVLKPIYRFDKEDLVITKCPYFEDGVEIFFRAPTLEDVDSVWSLLISKGFDYLVQSITKFAHFLQVGKLSLLTEQFFDNLFVSKIYIFVTHHSSAFIDAPTLLSFIEDRSLRSGFPLPFPEEEKNAMSPPPMIYKHSSFLP